MREYVDLRIDALDKKIDGVEKSLNARIDGVEKSLGARIDALDKRMDNMWRLMMGLFGLVAATIAVPQIIVAYRARGSEGDADRNRPPPGKTQCAGKHPIIISVRRLIETPFLVSPCALAFLRRCVKFPSPNRGRDAPPTGGGVRRFRDAPLTVVVGLNRRSCKQRLPVRGAGAVGNSLPGVNFPVCVVAFYSRFSPC